MKKLLTSAAFAALLITPAFAQDPAPVDQQAPAAMQPADPAAPAANPDGQSLPDDGAAMKPAMPADPAAKTLPDTAAAPAATQPGAEKPAVTASGDVNYIGEQSAEQQLVSAWIGKSVYNSADENLGDINDLVVGRTGSIDAVVLGVGGFLGIGEKSVAVPFSAVQTGTDANGNVKLTLNVTKDQLDAAPDFMTLADKQAKVRSEAPATDTPVAPATPAPAQ